jgi:hypothetical protein
MGGHIVIAFACMLVIRFPFFYEAVEDGFHICLPYKMSKYGATP